MEEKIRNYVNYQFRFDERKDIEDLKEEIIGNLIDRYHENLNSGKSSEEAYIASIKSLGDFSEKHHNDIPDEYSIKPSVPDILLMSGAILSVFGLLITLFSGIVGVLVTALSILLFSGAAYYLYSYSQFVRKQYMDIEKHNLLLQKIFKYMKTSFIFWSISLSLIMASLVMSIITRLYLINPNNFNYDSISKYITVYIIIFLIALVIFLIIFRNVYIRLINHYYYLTGTTELKGKIKEGYEFLHSIKIPRKSIVLSKHFFPILGLVLILPNLFFSLKFNYIIDWYSEYKLLIIALIEFIPDYFNLSVFPLFSLIIIIILIYLSFKGKLKNQWLLMIGFYAWFVSIIVMIILAQRDFNIDCLIVDYYSLFAIIILTYVVIYRLVKEKKAIETKSKEN